ncbi:hypothetical protein GCM10022221_22310 [Actinocorallia aurea]
MSSNGLKWSGGIVVGAAVGGLAVYLATLGWEKAGWVAGVVSMFLTVAGIGLAVSGEVRGRREAAQGGRPGAPGPGSAGPESSGGAPAPGSVSNTVTHTTNSGTLIQGHTISYPPLPPAPPTGPPAQDAGPADGAAGQG